MLQYTATTGDGDFSSLSEILTFAPSSGNGSLACISVAANADNLVEPEEYFAVELSLVTAEETSFQLGNPRSVVALIDSDGTFVIVIVAFFFSVLFTSYLFTLLLGCFVSGSIIAEVEFTIPTAASVTENSPSLIVCTTMRATPPSATLAMAVMLNLSAVDGTGKIRPYYENFHLNSHAQCAATSSSGDFNSTSTPVTFPIGSADSAEKCVSVTVNPDNLVESAEEFSLVLSLTDSGASLNLGDHMSTVTLIDSDGVYQLM